MRSSPAARKSRWMSNATEYLNLREDLVTNELQHDLDKLGIAKTAREEKSAGAGCETKDAPRKPKRAVREKNDEAYNARMASLYREVVLKEKPAVAGRIHSAGRVGKTKWQRQWERARARKPNRKSRSQ